MSLKIYDTLSRSLQPVEPMDGQTVRFYCCGPTVYGPAHIGNFRTFLVQDVFRRTLEAGGTKTTHVRNLTDVDDKTIRQSQAQGRTLRDFTGFWTQRFHKDGAALNLLPPTFELGAVAHIPQQIDLISKLVEKGFAYEKEGSVYFRVAAFPDYGKLSRLKERQITTNVPAATETEDSDEYERDSAADFVLWKARKPEDGPNAWPSPWGEGRPGWHIECSAMSMAYLGETFDLHAGGVDLIFPHHENEIAQSEAVTGKTFARLWFHNAHLLVDGKKMSKSLGNLITLDDVINKGFTAQELRYVLISGYYRQELNYTENSLNSARSALDKIARFEKRLLERTGVLSWTVGQEGVGEFAAAWEALNDDLNISKAFGEIFSAMKRIEENLLQRDSEDLHNCFFGLKRMLYGLGLDLPKEKSEEAPDEIQDLGKRRWAAKLEKNWSLADSLRQEISAKGWTMRDRKDGYDLSRA